MSERFRGGKDPKIPASGESSISGSLLIVDRYEVALAEAWIYGLAANCTSGVEVFLEANEGETYRKVRGNIKSIEKFTVKKGHVRVRIESTQGTMRFLENVEELRKKRDKKGLSEYFS